MRKLLITITALAVGICTANAQYKIPTSAKQDKKKVMSEAYWEFWNPEEQARIDSDIEKNRKADAEIALPNVGKKSKVKIEQLSHDFKFGAHIFNFNQLGKKEYNDRYKELYGTLFNQATVPFYWRDFEPEPGKRRFATDYRDTEEFWNKCANPYEEPHWRRPSTDQLVAFCKEKGISIHGHVLIWGNRRWQQPEWLLNLLTPEEKVAHSRLVKNEPDRFKLSGKFAKSDRVTDEYRNMSEDELAKTFSHYLDTVAKVQDERIRLIAEHYKSQINSWDVVNESAIDIVKKRNVEHPKVCKSYYGMMPGDYPYQALKSAEKYFPADVKLAINDYNRANTYTRQVKRLQERGCKIDIVGQQMHLFNPKQCLDIANGKNFRTPEFMRKLLGSRSTLNRPIHMSEITVTSPDNNERGLMIQAIITRNYYRLWFSMEKVMGITWWNVVDNCGARNEKSNTSAGLFTRDMQPKPSYCALNDLINKEWKTNLTTRVGKDGKVRFRGFKGNYRITWTDQNGKQQTMEYYLK